MDQAQIFKTVEQVLTEIQQKQGLKCPPLDANVRPLKDLECFDSPMSIAATGRIGRRLGIAIPPGKNIFGDSKGKYTLSKTVALLAEIAGVTIRQQAGV